MSHLSKSSTAEVENSTHVPREDRGGGEEYIFEDGNLSTHLIRNALGGAKREQVSVLLSIPAPLSRKYRDDVSFFLPFISIRRNTYSFFLSSVIRLLLQSFY